MSRSQCVTQIKGAIKRITDEPDLGLNVHKLCVKYLRLIVHSDSSFANMADLKTELGFVILLSNETTIVNRLHHRIYKCKRVVGSVLGAETHACADDFDASYAIRHDLQQIVAQNIPLYSHCTIAKYDVKRL